MIPAHERRILEAHVRGCKLSQLVLKQQDRPLNEYEEQQLKELVKQRAQGMPLQYLTGTQAFYGRDFYVNTCVLVPRPETEGLVELALEEMPTAQGASDGEQRVFALDFGTGSGCIALTLAHERKDIMVYAVDASKEALEVAIENARNMRETRVDFFQVSEEPQLWQFDHLPKLDLLISNPPYLVGEDDIATDVRQHEPPEALFAPATDPFYFYRFLADLALEKLGTDGIGAFEVADARAAATAALFSAKGFEVETHNDLTERARYLLIRKRG